MEQHVENIHPGKLWASALMPVVLLVVLLFVFLRFGPREVFRGSVLPIEDLFIQKVSFAPERVTVNVFNDGPDPVTIAQVLVNGAYWQFTMEPSHTVRPHARGTIELFYPWVVGDTERITLISKNGVTFEKEVSVAVLTPTFNRVYVKTFILIGIAVGVIPVLLGLLWLPFLRRLRMWYDALLSLTIGFLVFLGFDALAESFELIENLPRQLNGIGLLVMGFFLAVLTLSAVSSRTQFHRERRAEHHQALVWGYLIALGIGLHNLGEGLAVGSAYALGEIALGGSLVIGFMVHNVTEGVAIVAPLANTREKARTFLGHLVAMGLLAGAPTILGTLIGGFSYSVVLSVLFLAIGAGAIFDVAFDILHSMARGAWRSLFAIPNVLGFLVGLLVMYLTGFLVSA